MVNENKIKSMIFQKLTVFSLSLGLNIPIYLDEKVSIL